MGAAVSDTRARVLECDRGEALGSWVGFFSSEGRDQQVEDVLQDSDLGGLCSELCLGVVVVLCFGDRHCRFDCDFGIVENRRDSSARRGQLVDQSQEESVSAIAEQAVCVPALLCEVRDDLPLVPCQAVVEARPSPREPSEAS